MISIIVPVYNTREYLERCVNSLLAQTFRDIEIILVDDGSTDGSGGICDRFGAQEPRVRVFHKENGGSSSARNLGIDNARGEYIGFVDSDDYVDPDMYERLYRAVAERQTVCSSPETAACPEAADSPAAPGGPVNAAQIGRDERDAEGNILPDICIPPDRDECIPPERFLEELLMHRGDCSFCTKLIRREMFFRAEESEGDSPLSADSSGESYNRFPPGVLNEDFHLLIRMLDRIGPIVSLPGHAYHVFYRLGSNSRKESRENFSRVYGDCVDNAGLAAELVERRYPELKAAAFRFGIFQRLEYMLHIPIGQMNRENEMYRGIVRYLRRNWFKAMRNPLLTGKNKVYHTLFALAPRGIRRLHKRLRRM